MEKRRMLLKYRRWYIHGNDCGQLLAFRNKNTTDQTIKCTTVKNRLSATVRKGDEEKVVSTRRCSLFIDTVPYVAMAAYDPELRWWVIDEMSIESLESFKNRVLSGAKF